MPIDISEYTLNRMVYCKQDLYSTQLIRDTDKGAIHPSSEMTSNVIIRKGEIGFVANENYYNQPSTNEKLVSVCFNGSINYWMDPSWISLNSPSFALTHDFAKLVNHIRKLEKQIKEFDVDDRIKFLSTQIAVLKEHTEDLELERDTYLDAFSRMGLDSVDAEYIANGKICPKCFELFLNHNSDGSCVSEDDNDDDDDYSDKVDRHGIPWKDLYISELWYLYEEAVMVNEFEEGDPDWDWNGLEQFRRTILHNNGIEYEELNKFRNRIILDKYEQLETDLDEDEDEDYFSSSDTYLNRVNKIINSEEPQINLDDIELDQDVY